MSFAQLHLPGEPLFLPNAWDFASGAMLARQGYRAIGTTSLGVAAAAGLPDGEGAAKQETATLAGRLRRLPCYLTVDIESGFGDDPEKVASYVAGLGADGVNIEDAMGEPSVLSRKIAAIKRAVPEMFVNARTDTYWLGEASATETRRRLERYIEAGADGVFVPGVQDPAAIRSFAGCGRPLNILYAPEGLTLPQLADLGVARVSTGSLLFRIALGTLANTTPSYEEIQSLARS